MNFTSLQIVDKGLLYKMLWKLQPVTSELTFTNLFIWREHYGTRWAQYKDWLLFICEPPDSAPFALPPIGPSPRLEPALAILDWLAKEKKLPNPSIERVDKALADELQGQNRLSVTPAREHFDYVYLTQELIKLEGRKFHAKKNHVNKFTNTYEFVYEPLREEHAEQCLQMMNRWCTLKKCSEDMGLSGEWAAIKEAFENFQALEIQGGIIRINGKVEAFSLGEMLNENTAVIHIEKANPDFEGIYAAMNQQFCEHAWNGTLYINREQDMGIQGLRQAKISYNPEHFEEKFRVTTLKL